MDPQFYLEPVDEKGGRLRIAELPCTVGRSSDCDLQVNRDRISRQHARFELADGELVVEDLGSTNGTFVNGERIAVPATVLPGDTVHLADHEFRLIEDTVSGHTRQFSAAPNEPPTSQTIIGFTEGSTGFPVQAPAFYELLNDEQIAPQGWPVKTTGNRTFGLRLTGAGTHPSLQAAGGKLQHLAEQLGEESRLNEIIRRKGLEAADAADLEEPVLFLPVHATEIADADLLIDGLNALARTHRRLQLACETPLNAIDRHVLEALRRALNGMEIELAVSDIDPADAGQIESAAAHADYVIVDVARGAEAIARLLDRLAGPTRVIVENIDTPAALEPLRSLDDILLCGRAVHKPQSL